MTCDLGQIDAELNGILIQLSHTLHKIKTNLSVEERKNYFNRLSNSNQCVCDWLLELVQHKKGGSAANNSAQNNSQGDSNHNQLLNEFQSRCNAAPSSSTDLPEHTAQLSEERNPSQLATLLSPNLSNADAQSNVISIQPNLRCTSSIRNTTDVDLEDTSFANCPAHVSSKLSHIFARCIRNPQSFFSEICRDPIQITDGMPDVFFEIHDEKENSGIRAELCALYRRFKLRNFYLLAVRLDYHTGERWCRNASSQLADEIKKKHPSRELGDSDLKKYLDEYVRLGQRYNRWAEELGGPGYLLALPLEITERE
ncbi:hypothetical protein N7467_011881 [Penicillium canescens]|nr:hypothetical protein N7467_011881 [Penicillium canescens]